MLEGKVKLEIHKERRVDMRLLLEKQDARRQMKS